MDIARITTPGDRRSPTKFSACDVDELELPSNICTCSHPTLDPTPRRDVVQQYAPVRRAVSATAGIAAASRGAKGRSRARAALQAAASAALTEHSDVMYAISDLSTADGLPTKPEAIDLTHPDSIIPARSMGSLTAVADFSAAKMATGVRDAERRRGATGFGLCDVQLRHRSLMHRRAATSAAAGGSAGGDDATADEESIHREAAAREAARLKAAARLRRFAASPPPRFWWLLLLWLLGGYFGAHRVPLRAWRVVLMQCACAALGTALIVVATTVLHPRSVPEARYAFQEAYYVAGIGYGFGGVSGLLWLRDGLLLARMQLLPTKSGGHAAAAVSTGRGGARSRASGQPSSRDQRAVMLTNGITAATDPRAAMVGAAAEAAAIRESLKTDGSYRLLVALWLFGGYAFSAHRWKVGHAGRASFHVAVNVIAVALNLAAAYGDLHIGFAVMLTTGIGLASVAAVIWVRDLGQLFRGRLGPRRAAAPEYWLLLICLCSLGALGVHRLLLRRYRSAALFPMLFVIGISAGVDAATGLSWGLVVSAIETAAAAAESAKQAAAALLGNGTLGGASSLYGNSSNGSECIQVAVSNSPVGASANGSLLLNGNATNATLDVLLANATLSAAATFVTVCRPLVVDTIDALINGTVGNGSLLSGRNGTASLSTTSGDGGAAGSPGAPAPPPDAAGRRVSEQSAPPPPLLPVGGGNVSAPPSAPGASEGGNSSLANMNTPPFAPGYAPPAPPATPATDVGLPLSPPPQAPRNYTPPVPPLPPGSPPLPPALPMPPAIPPVPSPSPSPSTPPAPPQQPAPANPPYYFNEIYDEVAEMGRREFGVRFTEAVIATLALTTLCVALVRDLAALVRGQLRPEHESELYWRILYAWLLGGLPFGLHRLTASKVSWRLFPMLNAYGVSLLCAGEIYFKDNEGDPAVDPSRFTRGSVIAADVLASLALVAAFVMWLRDLPAVAYGRLIYKEERVLFYTALANWMLPTGILCGLHFVQFGRPYDWQLISSLTAVGIATGIAARQFAQFGEYELTFSMTLSTGLGCFGINFTRWFVFDGTDMRRGSVLDRSLPEAAFFRVRQLWLVGGFLVSAHQWQLGYRLPTYTTLLLHGFGGLLTYTALLVVQSNGEEGARNAFDTLRIVSIASLVLVLLLWLRDGLLLFLGKINLQGERVEVLDDEEGADDVNMAEPGRAGDESAKPEYDENGEEVAHTVPTEPPDSWRCFRTHLGTKYYFDPATEMVHYLSNNGHGNYAVDPLHNCTIMYDGLDDLADKLSHRGQPGYGGGGGGGSGALPADVESAAKPDQQV